jgi:hypothetical protein
VILKLRPNIPAQIINLIRSWLQKAPAAALFARLVQSGGQAARMHDLVQASMPTPTSGRHLIRRAR